MHKKSLIKERENVSAFVTCERNCLLFSSFVIKNHLLINAHDNTHAINI